MPSLHVAHSAPPRAPRGRLPDRANGFALLCLKRSCFMVHGYGFHVFMFMVFMFHGYGWGLWLRLVFRV